MQNYKSPQEAIIALEDAYTSQDIEKILEVKDFFTEAKLILNKANQRVEIELVNEVANLLQLSLIKSLQDNGFPNFKNATREFSNLNNYMDNIFFLEEKIIYPNNIIHTNKIFVTSIAEYWKVAMIEEE